jgi:hypothetical protein
MPPLKDVSAGKGLLPGNKWVPGAEPLALCMSCSSTYPIEAVECPNCQVGLSIVRKCPSCGRIQAANHVTCIYCADSFIREDGLAPVQTTRLRGQPSASLRQVLLVAGTALTVAVALGIVYYLTRGTEGKLARVIGQTYVLTATSMRRQADDAAPPVKDLHPSEILDITDYTTDSVGQRWFRVATTGISGYVRAEMVAPPKSRDPIKGYEILRHSLLGLDDSEALPAAVEAVDLYGNLFPSSPHTDELRWLLAERTRDIAGRSGQSRALLASAREQYEKLARGNSEFAEPARQALAELPDEGPARATSTRGSQSSAPSLSILGGSLDTMHPTGATNTRAPVRGVTEISSTPLWIQLTQGTELSPGQTFQGEFAQDIRVNREIAIPRGSPATLRIAPNEDAGSLGSLRLTAATVEGESYQISAVAVRLEGSGINGRSLKKLPLTLPAGTRVEFQLQAPLVIRQK